MIATARGAGGWRLAILAMAAVLWSGAAAEAQRRPCEGRLGTPAEAQRLAEDAVRHIGRVGVREALIDFMTPNAGFIRDDLYVFVFDSDGRILVNAGFPGLIGQSAFTARDERGRPFLYQAMQRALKAGNSWVEYVWYNPCTGEPMPKSTYMIHADGLFIAVGAYGSVST